MKDASVCYTTTKNLHFMTEIFPLRRQGQYNLRCGLILPYQLLESKTIG